MMQPPEDYAADSLDRASPSRNASSKYDFVKVKVWLGENADHYYVLSRFLLCRMLTITKIPNHVAIKIALELKKLLVDNSLLDVSHSDLEANLFKLMEKRGYCEDYINRYKMMTRWKRRSCGHPINRSEQGGGIVAFTYAHYSVQDHRCRACGQVLFIPSFASPRICLLTRALLVEALSRAKSMVEASEARTQEAELARDRLITVALNVLRVTPLLTQGSSSINIDSVVQQLERVPAAHDAELRETAKLASNHALAIMKLLYPQVELDAVCDGFAIDYNEETGMKYINEAEVATRSVAFALGL
uniref:Uncharacterized protein n=1 Tax=Oryza brachyantha TaxID=4533 RepID=J3KU22_ORYBR